MSIKNWPLLAASLNLQFVTNPMYALILWGLKIVSKVLKFDFLNYIQKKSGLKYIQISFKRFNQKRHDLNSNKHQFV